MSKISSFLTVIGLSFVSHASATVVFSEDFDSAPTGFSFAGWTHESGNPWVVTADATGLLDNTVNKNVYYNAGGSLSDNQKNVGLSIGGSYVLGTVGEYIQVSFDYLYYAAPSTGGGTQPFNFFRYGLYDNNSTASTYNDDLGYLADVSYWDNTTTGGKFGDYSVRREFNWYDNGGSPPPENFSAILLDNKSSTDYSAPTTPETGDIRTVGGSTFKTTIDGIASAHNTTLRMTRTATGVQLDLTQDSITYVSNLDTAGIYTTFNTLYFEGPADGNGFAVDNILVTTGAVPEPTRVMLLGLGLAGLLLRRRR
ncbi:MAG: PEP-CTERM sorting domain-containing protein [Verrucomicrobiaceae bacterium]